MGLSGHELGGKGNPGRLGGIEKGENYGGLSNEDKIE
jgi:hypothetical protein